MLLSRSLRIAGRRCQRLQCHQELSCSETSCQGAAPFPLLARKLARARARFQTGNARSAVAVVGHSIMGHTREIARGEPNAGCAEHRSPHVRHSPRRGRRHLLLHHVKHTSSFFFFSVCLVSCILVFPVNEGCPARGSATILVL